MRPVNKGKHPIENGNPFIFKEYGDARDFLFERLGNYCSYCEMRSDEGPAIEHMQPKAIHPAFTLLWSNFLLGCRFCNGSKKAPVANPADYFWPDQDNTYRIFLYEYDRAPQVSPTLSDADQQIAKATLKLTGLEREPGHPELTPKDRRWLKRREAWGKATTARERLQEHPSVKMREQIVDTAIANGFWSVWMTVFADDLDMKQRLLDKFPGTSKECFDENLQPIFRPNGRI